VEHIPALTSRRTTIRATRGVLLERERTHPLLLQDARDLYLHRDGDNGKDGYRVNLGCAAGLDPLALEVSIIEGRQLPLAGASG